MDMDNGSNQASVINEKDIEDDFAGILEKDKQGIENEAQAIEEKEVLKVVSFPNHDPAPDPDENGKTINPLV